MEELGEQEIHEKKLVKMQSLQDILHKCTCEEPVLDYQTIAMVLSFEISDISDFLKAYKKENKKEGF